MLSGHLIENFFDKKQILITGGTGFLGTALVEKLLRSFPQIGKIYLLIRNNKSGSAASRSDKYFENKLFSRVHEVNPTYISKIEWLEGDLCATNLGLSNDVIEKLKKSLDIIVHSGATVNLKEHLKKAIHVNLGGTKNVLELAKSCANIKCYLHVSTAFVNHKESTNELKEIIYPQPVNPEVILAFSKSSEKTAKEMEDKFLVGWYNSYLFTKSAAENLVHEYRNILPIGIYRPAIVSHSYTEPYPYWITKGTSFPLHLDILAKAMEPQYDPDFPCNMVPVDMTVNALLVTIINVAVNSSPDELQIYNYTASTNPCPLNNMMKYYNGDDKTLNFEKPKFSKKLISNAAIWNIDIETFVGFAKSIKDYFFSNFHFDSSNIDKLWDSLDEEGKKLLPFNIRDVDWEKYFTELYKEINE